MRRTQDAATDAVTAFAGSATFVYLHTAWFAIWVLINIFGPPFDPYPYGLLTLVVSLEAIFLSTFVMISQNRSGARADVRAEMDFETNLRSEVWTVAIGRRLGLDTALVEERVKRIIALSRDELTTGVDCPEDAFLLEDL